MKITTLTLVVLASCSGQPNGAGGGGGGGGEGGGGGSMGNDGGRRAFLTSSQFTGNLRAAANAAVSGFEGADTLCARHASDAGLKGKWVAFVGSTATSPASRVSGSGPWSKRLPDAGRTVMIVDLASAPASSVDVDERGRSASGEIWSGRGGPECGDWRADTGSGTVGSATPSGGAGWQNVGSRLCSLKFSLLCLEQ